VPGTVVDVITRRRLAAPLPSRRLAHRRRLARARDREHGAGILVNDQIPGNDARSTVARVPHAAATTQLIVHEANLNPGDRLQARLWHGFADQVRADVCFQTRRLGDSS
jgi:hypothetical protein